MGFEWEVKVGGGGEMYGFEQGFVVGIRSYVVDVSCGDSFYWE